MAEGNGKKDGGTIGAIGLAVLIFGLMGIAGFGGAAVSNNVPLPMNDKKNSVVTPAFDDYTLNMAKRVRFANPAIPTPEPQEYPTAVIPSSDQNYNPPIQNYAGGTTITYLGTVKSSDGVTDLAQINIGGTIYCSRLYQDWSPYTQSGCQNAQNGAISCQKGPPPTVPCP